MWPHSGQVLAVLGALVSPQQKGPYLLLPTHVSLATLQQGGESQWLTHRCPDPPGIFPSL